MYRVEVIFWKGGRVVRGREFGFSVYGVFTFICLFLSCFGRGRENYFFFKLLLFGVFRLVAGVVFFLIFLVIILNFKINVWVDI